ncbi:hypothetical protein ACHAWF_014262 [Thalassiosira exigua]
MNAASAAARAAARRRPRLLRPPPPPPSPPHRRPFAAQVQPEPPSAAPKTWSENEFPERKEPPVIARTRASDVAPPPSTREPPPPRHAVSPTRSIGPERPSRIPPNVPLDALAPPATEVTTLSNGVRVGSVENFSQVSTVGVFLDFGSRHELDRYEVPGTGEAVSTAGVNHLMELLAFQSTRKHTGDEIRNAMESMGGASYATSNREQMMYCCDVLRPNVGRAFELMAEAIKIPAIEEAEVEETKQVIRFQMMDAHPQLSMMEGLQTATYGPIDGRVQQLGRPHLCTEEALEHLTAASVHAFREQHLLHKPRGIVVAGSGIAHDALVELADAHFGHIPAGGAADDDDGRTVPSVHTGGEYRLQRPPDPNPAKEEFTHVALAFEVGGWHSPDLVPTCVLQTLLGGGSSFSAGGPGKGMYSRLYRQVLNAHGWAESCEAFTSFHDESGLWGIAGSCEPERSRDLTLAIADQFSKLGTDLVADEELDRARNMLKCNVLTQLESRLVLMEDVGRQMLTYGKREDAATMCAKIDAVTREDVRDVVRRATAKPLTLSTVGIDVGKVPRLEEAAKWVGEGPEARKKKNSFFERKSIFERTS